ncbi:MAG: trp operon repressor [Simkaniaceae bacterium]|nr:trp operon repressor [Simkaniaceae bacterium]
MTGWEDFLFLCSECTTSHQLDELFSLFLTLEEKEDIGKRVLLVKNLMAKKLSQRDIAQKCHVSIAKITRGSNALKMISQGLKEFISRCFNK